MKRKPYCNKKDIEELVLTSAMRQCCLQIADNTEDIGWRRKFKTAAAYFHKTVIERLDCLICVDDVKNLERRSRNTYCKFFSSAKEAQAAPIFTEETHVPMEIDDFYDLVELANQSCLRCQQGDKVKDCKWRKMFHKYFVPVARDNPAPNECEYRWDNGLRFIDPFTMKEVKAND